MLPRGGVGGPSTIWSAELTQVRGTFFSDGVSRIVLCTGLRSGVASFVTDPSSGWGGGFVTEPFFGMGGGEFCDGAFFRDGVASFVTEPFFELGSRVL